MINCQVKNIFVQNKSVKPYNTRAGKRLIYLTLTQLILMQNHEDIMVL